PHVLPDLRRRRLRVALEQRVRANDQAGYAEPALGRLFLDEGALHRPWICDRAEAFERPDPGALEDGNRNDAREYRPPFDEHGTRAALAQAAAVFGTVQLQVIAQHVEQGRCRIDVDLVLASVDVESDHLHPSAILRRSRRLSWPSAPRPPHRATAVRCRTWSGHRASARRADHR